MNPRTTIAAAAVAATLLNVAFMAPVQAQVKAALTRDVDRSSAQPVNGRCSVGTNSSGNIKCTLYTVPAGKRLVVETVGYVAATAIGSVVYLVLFGQDAGYSNLLASLPNVFTLAPVHAYDQYDARVYAGTQALKMYLDAGQVLAAGDAHGGTANYDQNFSFSGYLVDK